MKLHFKLYLICTCHQILMTDLLTLDPLHPYAIFEMFSSQPFYTEVVTRTWFTSR